MHAILIHYIGYLLIDQLMPYWVDEAGWLILSTWYASFVAIDMIAIMVNRRWDVLVALASSCAWSACLMIEVCMGSDLLQRHDASVQWVINAIFAWALVMVLIDCWPRRKVTNHG